jgi:RTX calcium-binding nonapeptide repeat (4 copies)
VEHHHPSWKRKERRRMRRIAILVALSALLVGMVAGVAVAVDKICQDKPCRGTENNDRLEERTGNEKDDRILGLDGEDLIDAGEYRRDKDVLEGGKRDDRLFTDDGDGQDTARGDRGSDRCVADGGDRVISCRRINPASAEAKAMAAEVSSASEGSSP